LAWGHPIVTEDYVRREVVSDNRIQPGTVVTVDSGNAEGFPAALKSGLREDTWQVERVDEGMGNCHSRLREKWTKGHVDRRRCVGGMGERSGRRRDTVR